jgi:membrane protease YdiL (CAAX protease family)
LLSHVLNLIWILVLIVGIPIASYLTMRQEEIFHLPRKSLYLSAAVSQWLLVLLTVLIGLTAPGGWDRLKAIAPSSFLAWTAVLVVVSLAGMGLALLSEIQGWWPGESRWVLHLLPHTRQEKVWSVLLLAPTAGFCEELIYRGYLLSQLSRYLHSVDAAWAVSSAAFGLAHLYQKASGTLRAAALGALLTYPVIRLGTIYPSMATHFLIDVLALVWLGPASLRRQADSQSGL